MKKKSLLASGAKLSVLTLISRILGLIRESTKAALLGTSSLADAFGIAFMLPNLFRRLFAENSISVAFIPTFRAYLEDQDKETTQKFVNATFTLVSFLTVIVVLLGIALAPFIVPIFAEDSTAEILPEMAFLTRIMFPYLFVISIAALFQGILNGLKIFTPSGFTPILFNIIVIAASYLLSPFTQNPARAMSIGVIAGGTVQALFQLPFVLKQNWQVRFTSIKQAFCNPGTKKVVKLVVPTIVGMAAYQLNDVVSTALAGQAGTGVVSSLQYSLRLQELILGIFAVSIGTVILPDLSGLAKQKEWNEFNKMLIQAIKIIALITIPVTFFAILFGENIITIVYKTNQFTDESVNLTLKAFFWHIIGLYFIALNRIIAPAFYAQGDTKSPTFAGVFSFAINILLAAILVKPLSGGGIALALTIASFGNTIMLFVFMKKSGSIDIKNTIKATIIYSLKLIVLSAIAIIPLFLLKPYLFSILTQSHRFIAQGVPLAIAAIIFFSIGIILLLVTKDSLITSIFRTLKKRFL